MQRRDRSGGTPQTTEPIEFAVELHSDLRSIEGTVGYLAQRCEEYGFQGSRLNLNFRVGVTEALANAMTYGSGGDPSKRVRVEVSLSSAQVVVQVIDEGEGFDPGVVPDPTTPQNLESPGGRGIFLLRELMDEVRYNECGNAVRLVLHRSGPARRAAGA